jgi:large subunit ribosomal protein L30
MTKLRITYTKSSIGYSRDQKETVRSLGLRKLNSTVVQNDTPAIRGMIFKVRHLVSVEDMPADTPVAAPSPARRTTAVAEKRQTTAVAEKRTVATKRKSTASDDLTVIEGIGPKIGGLLQAAGIHTFGELAATDTARLTEILQAANLRLASPETWPEQAQLAAAADWDGLKQLQDRLKGGRRE